MTNRQFGIPVDQQDAECCPFPPELLASPSPGALRNAEPTAASPRGLDEIRPDRAAKSLNQPTIALGSHRKRGCGPDPIELIAGKRRTSS